MAFADMLEHVTLAQWRGVIFAVGLYDGSAWFTWSNDAGETDAGAYVEIDPCDEVRPALEILRTGELSVALTISEHIVIYRSADWGQTWEEVGTI